MGVGSSMKGTGVDSTVATIGRQELREGTSHVVTDEGGDGIFFAIRDDKIVVSIGLHPIFDPAGSWVDTRLRACRAGSLPFGVSFLGLVQCLLSCKFVIEYDCHALVIERRCAGHRFIRERNGKWLGAGRRTVGIGWVDDVRKFVTGI